eukprot:351877-Chlamydomonas_euryale.AAC.7
MCGGGDGGEGPQQTGCNAKSRLQRLSLAAVGRLLGPEYDHAQVGILSHEDGHDSRRGSRKMHFSMRTKLSEMGARKPPRRTDSASLTGYRPALRYLCASCERTLRQKTFRTDEGMPQTRNMAAQETWKQEDYANVKGRCAAALKSEKNLELCELKHERVLIVERSLTTWEMGFDVYGLIIEADEIPDPDDKADTAVHHEHARAKLAVTRLRAV